MRLRPSHSSNDNELPQGGHGHPFWSWRGWWNGPEPQYKTVLHIQWLAGRKASFHAKYGRDHMESEHQVSFGLPFLFDVYINWSAKYVDGQHDRKSYGLSVHHGAVWWEWADGDDWHRGQPWWQSFNINPLDVVLGHTSCTTTVLSKTDAELPLPEGPVPVTVELEYRVWRRPRWPFAVGKRYTAEVAAKDPDGILAPGKGENSWDCGDNNIQSLHCEARTVEEGLAAMLKSVLSTRKRHGGSHSYESREVGSE